MSRRRRAREVVLQVLYQDDLNPTHDLRVADNFVRSRLLNNDDVSEFALSLLWGTRRNRRELDAMLEKHAANWSLKRMAATDRNILRMATYELMYTETPGRVVINEAVELAKRFGSKQSAQFVNGILDVVLKQTSSSGEGSTGTLPTHGDTDDTRLAPDGTSNDPPTNRPAPPSDAS